MGCKAPNANLHLICFINIIICFFGGFPNMGVIKHILIINIFIYRVSSRYLIVGGVPNVV